MVEGSVGLLKKSKVHSPLLEGPLKISNRPRSMGGGPDGRGVVVQRDARIMRDQVIR